MPELPDVEVYRKYLDSTSLHQRIKHVHVETPSILNNTSPQGLGHALKDHAFISSTRHGKYLFVSIDNNKWLMMHFGMTGAIKYFRDRKSTPDYSQALFSFENGYHLAYTTIRKLGRIELIESPQEWLKRNRIGTDALELTEDEFINQAKQRRGGVKSWLMDQKSIAGIGNIYSDEILFQSKIHPKRPVSSLDEASMRRLYKNLRDVLNKSISAGANPDKVPNTFFLPHRRKGGHCPNCNTLVKSVKVGGRTAWYCPHCQNI